MFDKAEHVAHIVAFQHTLAMGNGLIEQAECVAQTAIGSFRDHWQRGIVVGNFFGDQNMLQTRNDLLRRQRLQMELQATGQHRYRHFLRVGGRQQEHHMRRWLFQGFQQRIETAVRQHVHFVDQVDFVATPGR